MTYTRDDTHQNKCHHFWGAVRGFQSGASLQDESTAVRHLGSGEQTCLRCGATTKVDFTLRGLNTSDIRVTSRHTGQIERLRNTGDEAILRESVES